MRSHNGRRQRNDDGVDQHSTEFTYTNTICLLDISDNLLQGIPWFSALALTVRTFDYNDNDNDNDHDDDTKNVFLWFALEHTFHSIRDTT
ncbi:hypothetical protein M0802_002190 [Mischocyttarus mexicanus]|nr:hypothetical protein M0802_002190 [Mischocyttarus mexicanus]